MRRLLELSTHQEFAAAHQLQKALELPDFTALAYTKSFLTHVLGESHTYSCDFPILIFLAMLPHTTLPHPSLY